MEENETAESKLMEERKKKFISFVKEKYNWVFYLILAGLVIFAMWIRSLPMKIRPETGKPGLWDITTDHWTLGPDLDPFLFLRWAKDIVEKGAIAANDAMRYVPVGFETKFELTPLSYMIAWFHKLASGIGISESVTHSAVMFPVFMFGLTVIAFFFLTRKIFVEHLGSIKANLIASIASFFLIVLPPLLARTIAGIPEKESAGFFFLFVTFYFFISAWKAKSIRNKLILALLSGLSTAGMAGVWGGYQYILVTLGLSLFMAFILGNMSKDKLFIAITWLASSLIIMNFISTRYNILDVINSTITLIPLGVIALISVHEIIFSTKLKNYFESERFSKVPKQVISMIVALFVGLIAVLIIFGPGYVYDKLADVTKPLITPVTDRLGLTVAENRQPYFSEWSNSFGPHLNGIPLFFWLFLIGSVYLYARMLSFLSRREKIVVVSGYVIFLFAVIFSRYRSDSILNGTNTFSMVFYLAGVLCLLASFGYYYYQYFKNKNLEVFKSIDFGLILLFSFFFFGIISARGSVRTIMMLVPPAAIIVSYMITDASLRLYKIKSEGSKVLAWIIIALLLSSSAYSGFIFYQQTKGASYNNIPSVYTQQWQLAMSWVRENTSQDAVFGHWWDYGYWVQSIGERATILDGGNAISYWNHFMGRYALTGTSNTEALEFLYAHNTTHFLIDSTEIGKYNAFSTIGSDENYDRASYIPTLVQDKQQTRESKNSSIYVYQGGFSIDSDIIYDLNGSQIFLPSGRAGVRGILIEKNNSGALATNPVIVVAYQNRDYNLPLRYAYHNGNLIDFGSGVEAGVFLFPAVVQGSGGFTVEKDYTMLYLSERAVKSQMTRLYLYNEDNAYFNLVHSEDDLIVQSLKSQGAIGSNEDIVYYQGLRGPIRIWEINYPENISFKQEFLVTQWPSRELQYGSK